MKFKFCGDLDCPDHILAEIGTLSKLTAIKIKLLNNQIVGKLVGDNIDFEKVVKLTADAKFETADIQALIIVISTIISNAVKYNVKPDVLINELQQLGLPKEHATAICKTYEENSEKIRLNFLKNTLRAPYLKSVSWKINSIHNSPETSKRLDEFFVCIHFEILNTIDNVIETKSIALTYDTFKLLLSELKNGYKIMEKLL